MGSSKSIISRERITTYPDRQNELKKKKEREEKTKQQRKIKDKKIYIKLVKC